MNYILDLFKKVPLKFRKAALYVLIAIGFVISVQGFVDGGRGWGFVGLLIAAVPIAILVVIYKDNKQF